MTLVAVTSTACTGCTPKSNGRSRIAVSIFPVYDLTRRIAGPDADVILLVPPSRDAHVAPAGADGDLKDVRVAVMVGLGFDAWVEDATKIASPKAKILKVGDRVSTLPLGAAASAAYPYVWLDPDRARLIVKAIAEDMARTDAAHANAYRARANDVDSELEKLDKELGARAQAWPKKDVSAANDGAASLAYFADRYGLKASTAPAGAASAPRIDVMGTGDATYEALERRVAAALEAQAK